MVTTGTEVHCTGMSMPRTEMLLPLIRTYVQRSQILASDQETVLSIENILSQEKNSLVI